MIWEMVLLSLIARVIYKKAVPDPSGPAELPQQICTIGMKIPLSIVDHKPVENNNNFHISEKF